MKKYIKNITALFKNEADYILSVVLMASFFFILFRIEIFNLIESIYTELEGLSFIQYIFMTFGTDSLSILMLVIFLLLIIFATSGKPFLRTVLLSFSMIILMLSLLLSIEFFRVYETGFQWSYVGQETLTGLSDVAGSYFAESSTGFYVKLAIGSFFIITFFSSVKRLKSNGYEGIPLDEKKQKLALSVFFSILLIGSFIPGADSDKMKRSFPGIQEKRLSTMLYELSLNPVSATFFAHDVKDSTAYDESGKQNFNFRLNTDSILEKRIYPRINTIQRGKEYNIIFYFFESTPQKYMDLKIKGKSVVPNWQRLMNNSFVANNHYANYPLSANAMLSILTSAYDHPSKDHVIQKFSNIKLKAITEILKQRNYRTCLLHTGDLRYAGQRRFLKNRKIDKIIEYDDLKDIPPYNNKVGWGVDERAMIEPAVKFMKEKKSPFFAAFFPVNPHHPYAIPDDSFRITEKVTRNMHYKKRNWLNYLNSLHYADAALGELIDRLEKESLLENTLVFIFADHGEAFYQHRKNYNHPFFLYEENVHVPLIVYNKKIFSQRIDFMGITRHVDILPSVMDALNIRQLPEQEGISLFGARREQLALLHTYWKDDIMAVRDSNWKYIRRMKDGLEELYDLSEDPDEMKNLALENKSLLSKYRLYIREARQYKMWYYNQILNK